MLLLLIGCANFGFDWFSDDTAADTGEGVELLPNPTADIDWDADRFRLTITQGDNYSFRFGIAETSAECGINTDVGCWTGEDCGSGYESPQGTYIHSATCHPAVANGTLSLNIQAPWRMSSSATMSSMLPLDKKPLSLPQQQSSPMNSP